MRYFIFTICCVLSLSLSAQDGVSIRLNDFTTIEFPSTPEFVERGSAQVFTVQDSLGVYLVVVRPLTELQNALIINNDGITSLYTETAKGVVDDGNGSIVASEISYFDGVPILEIEYTTPYNEKLPSLRFKRLIYTNPDLILIDYWPTIDDRNQIVLEKLKFFNSLELDETRAAAIQEQLQNEDPAKSIAYLIGKIEGILIFFGLLIGLVVLIVWLIVRKKPKKIPVKQPESTRPARPVVSSITCKNCGAENKSNFKYCVKCGYEL